MTTTELEQLMLAHKCGFSISNHLDVFECELIDTNADLLHESGIVGWGQGKDIVEAVYEALKSKCGRDGIENLFMEQPPYSPEEMKL